MKKILFFIPNLNGGGAEKVLVNLCNNLTENYDITIMTLFDVGVNKKNISKNIQYRYCHKKRIIGIRYILKLFSPRLLANHYIKEDYDIVIAYLEGTVTRIVSGLSNKKTKKIAWLHSRFGKKEILQHYRTNNECLKCYSDFNKIVAVSEDVKNTFLNNFQKINSKIVAVLHNINESNQIKKLSQEKIGGNVFNNEEINAIVVGKIAKMKGIFRLIQIFQNHKEDLRSLHIYFLGQGPDFEEAISTIKKENLENNLTFLGYQTNPYKYISKCDFLICPSYTEGLSTSVVDALILGIPVLATDCGGMYEILGNNEFGLIVKNNEDDLFDGLKKMYIDTEYRNKLSKLSEIRGKIFSKENILKETLELLENTLKEE